MIVVKYYIFIVEIYEMELVDIEKVIVYYEQFVDYYKGEEFNSLVNKCLLKVVGYVVLLE